MPRPLTPLFDPVTRHGRKPPVPTAYSLASGALTDQRDTAAGTATVGWLYKVSEIITGGAFGTGPNPAFDNARQNLYLLKRSSATAGATLSYDVSDPVTPVLLDTLNGQIFHAAGYDPINERIYGANSASDGFGSVDATDPSALTVIAFVSTGGLGQPHALIFDSGATAVFPSALSGSDPGRLFVTSAPSFSSILDYSVTGTTRQFRIEKVDENTVLGISQNGTAVLLDITNRAAPSVTWLVSSPATSFSRFALGSSSSYWYGEDAAGGQNLAIRLISDGSLFGSVATPMSISFGTVGDGGRYIALIGDTECCVADLNVPTAPRFSNVVTYASRGIATDNTWGGLAISNVQRLVAASGATYTLQLLAW